MVKLDPIQTFVQVVRAGGFSAAARQTGMPRSTVSLQVSSLEAALGTRLLKRSTRAIALTDEGRHLYDRACGALETLSEALTEVTNTPGVISGLIHLTAPADFPTDLLGLAITSFRALHPAVRFQITLTNEALDFVTDNVDIAVRMGGGTDMDAVQRPLMDFGWQFCASSRWLEHHPIPKTIEAIPDFISPTPTLRAYLQRSVLGGESLPPPSIEIDNQYLAKDLILCGFGVGLVPTGLCLEAIRNGEVKTFLDHLIIAPTRLTLTFPTRADMVPRVKIFADHISRTLREDREMN